MKGKILLAAALGGLLLAAAGCGGASNAAQTIPSVPTTTGSVTTSTTAPGLGSLASAANCRQLANLGSQMSSAFAGQNKNIETEAALLQQFADRTPTAVRPDFEVYASAFSKIANALKGVNLSSGKTPSPTVLAKLASLSSQINQTALQKASQHIATWATQNCHA